MKKKLSMLLLLVMTLALCLAGCGKKDNDLAGNAGTYRLVALAGMKSDVLYELLGYDSEEEAKNAFKVRLREDGSCTVSMMGEDDEEAYWSLDGDEITISEVKNPGKNDEKITGRLADGGMVLDIDGQELVLALKGCEEAALAMSKSEDLFAGLEGGVDSGSSSGSGDTVTWGEWTVTVPAGYEFEGGDFIDSNDTTCFSIKEADSSFTEMKFNANGKEDIMNKYNYNKDTYTEGQEDVSATYGGNEWIGFSYVNGFEAYTTIDGEMIRVSASLFYFDSDVVKEVLGSIKHNAAGSDAGSGEETEAAEDGETYTNADFSVFVPEGWLAIPERYVERDVDLIKGAEDEWDTYGKCHILIKKTDDPDYVDTLRILYDSCEEAEPVTYGNRTWTGIDGQYSADSRRLSVMTEYDGAYLAASIWYVEEEGSISLDDADVVAIMESIGNGKTAGGSSKDTKKDTSDGKYEDAGYYELISYEEDGVSWTLDELAEVGITRFSLMLYEDGSGYCYLLDEYYELTWEEGSLYVNTDYWGTGNIETLEYTTSNTGGKYLYIDGYVEGVDGEDVPSLMTFEYVSEPR